MTAGGAAGEGGRWVMDLEASALPMTGSRGGLLMRLANDCVLLDSWSSAANLARCVRAVRSCGAVSRVADERRAEYDCGCFPLASTADLASTAPVVAPRV